MTSSSRRRSQSHDWRRNSRRNRSRSKRRSRSPKSPRRSTARRRSPRRRSPSRRRSPRRRSPSRRRSRRRSRSRGRRGRSRSSSPSLDAKIRQRRAARRTNFQSPPPSIVPDSLTPTPALQAAANATQLADAATAASATLATFPAPIPDGPPEQTKGKPPPPPPPKTVTERKVESSLNTIAMTMGMGQSAPAVTVAPPMQIAPNASTVPVPGSHVFDPLAAYDPSAPCDFSAPPDPSAAAAIPDADSTNTAVPSGWGFAAKMATRVNDRPVVQEEDTSYGTGAARNRTNDPFASMYGSRNKSTSSAPKRDIASLDKFRIKKKPPTPSNTPLSLGNVSSAAAAAAGCGVPAFCPPDGGSGVLHAPTFIGAGTGNMTVDQLLLQGTPQFVSFNPDNPDAAAAAMNANQLQASGINTALLPAAAAEPAPPAPPPIVVRPKLAPNYTGLERFKLPFPPQKTAVAVVNEIGTKCGRFVEFHTVEERDENKSFTEKYSFTHTDQKRWMQWKARFQTTVLHLHSEPVTGDWCTTKSNSVTVAAEKTLMIMYGSNPEQMWLDCTGKSQKAQAKAKGIPPSGGGNKISEVNEMLQKMFRGQFQGQFMQWTYLPAGKGRMIAQVYVPPLEKSFDGPAQPSKKDAQREAVCILHKYLMTQYYN